LNAQTTASIKKLAEKAKLTLFDTVYNSDGFQFWGSELYLRDIQLHSNLAEATKSTFTKKQLKEYARRAAELNRQKQGDMAAFYLRHATNQG
jgi:hypothetical protein